MKTAKIEVCKGVEEGRAYWRLRAANGEIVAVSEIYKGGVKAARRGAKALLAAVASMAAASIVEV